NRGVNLAGDGAVIGERADPDEIELKVTTGRGPLALSVSLYPLDEEWDCSCPSHASVCEHVVAAILALRQARGEGLDLPGPSEGVGHVQYRLGRVEDALVLNRAMVTGERAAPLLVSLTDAAAGRAPTPPVAIGVADLDVEQILGRRLLAPDGVRIPKEQTKAVLKALASCEDVVLDGERVTCSPRPIAPVGTVTDDGDGFHVKLAPAVGIEAAFANGAALCGGLLRPLWSGPIPPYLMRGLFRGRTFGRDELPELMTEVLPLLRSHLQVEIETARLPGVSPTPPRIELTTGQAEARLHVMAQIVYGDPVVGRIVEGRLVVEGTTVPVRNPDAEDRLTRELARQLGLTPGIEATLDGEEAVRFTRRLVSWDGDLVGTAHETYTEAPPLSPAMAVDGDRFEITFTTTDGRRADAGAVLGRWHGGAAMVPLMDGGWSPLPEDFLALHGRLVADLLEARREDGTVPACVLPDLARLCEAEGLPAPAGLARFQALLDDFDGLPEAALPGDLTATLRNYQRRGVDWLAFLRALGWSSRRSTRGC
ncbi:MAG: SWIM zinc finger family protein, partial [Myxococcota bacterium]|nr:SWIM zinc finger family protein [Myxococcota bacterium]